MDAEKVAAFALVTGLSSLVPGPSMLFVLSQSIWRGARSGTAALIGVQLGYIVWWLLAAAGLGTLAAAFPLAFRLLAVGGALYLAWLGVQALRHTGAAADEGVEPARGSSRHAFRDGIFVAIGNPKSLVYIVALLPPFVDTRSPVVPQLVVLAIVAMVIDVALGLLYIGAGSRIAKAMERPSTRLWLDRGVGLTFIAIALAILAELFGR
ncbi:LysE family translocator [Croceibacterium soli]|uniref:LysE family translocator n=1 Tax=Croceibacterium soli TaxID=1739690 RepID=UPI001F186C92|nr:LysE family translocator [Croceibacterium soli]